MDFRQKLTSGTTVQRKSAFTTIIGIVIVILLTLSMAFFLLGRSYVKPFLSDSLGDWLFPPLATPVEKNYGSLFEIKELPQTPSSIFRASEQWAAEHKRTFVFCERVSSESQRETKKTVLHNRVDDDPDYATCLRYVRSRMVDGGTEIAIPGQWLPGRRFDETARQDFEAILVRRPDFFYAAYLLGCWHRQNGDFEAAERCFEQAYEAAPVVLVMSLDLLELAESWEQNRPPQLTLLNNRTFAHNIDLTYHYGLDDAAMVRYPMLRSDENGLILIPAECEWLSWERTFETGQRAPAPLVGQKNMRTWYFHGEQNAVSLLQHAEIIVRPYDTNLMRTDPFFDPFWGTQQSLAPYERVATYCESQSESSFLFDRQVLTSSPIETCWQSGRVVPLADLQPDMPGFQLLENGKIRPFNGTFLAVIDSPDSRLLTYYLQQTGLTRSSLIAKIQARHAEGISGVSDIEIPPDKGLVFVVIDRDHAAWLVKLTPTHTATTLRIGCLHFVKNVNGSRERRE